MYRTPAGLRLNLDCPKGVISRDFRDRREKQLAYFLDLFSPETWAKYWASDRSITGFRPRSRGIGAIQPGDYFLCYLTVLSRWCGLLQVESQMFEDSTPIFAKHDQFTARFKVNPIALLEPMHAIPIKDPSIWNGLSVTKDLNPNSKRWTGLVRGSLKRIEDHDGEFLAEQLLTQSRSRRVYPLADTETRRVKKAEQRQPLPESRQEPATNEFEEVETSEPRESIQVQAKVATIGAAMGLNIWIPPGDKSRVLSQVAPRFHSRFLDELPLAYDQQTLSTIKQIDVLWIDRQSMARAFEVEHSTAVYSGLLRMSDLVALQPNIDIQLHIVAPNSKRQKVKREILRPTFERLVRRPLSDRCTFISYEAIDRLVTNPNLSYFRSDILDQYTKSAHDID